MEYKSTERKLAQPAANKSDSIKWAKSMMALPERTVMPDYCANYNQNSEEIRASRWSKDSGVSFCQFVYSTEMASRWADMNINSWSAKAKWLLFMLDDENATNASYFIPSSDFNIEDDEAEFCDLIRRIHEAIQGWSGNNPVATQVKRINEAASKFKKTSEPLTLARQLDVTIRRSGADPSDTWIRSLFFHHFVDNLHPRQKAWIEDTRVDVNGSNKLLEAYDYMGLAHLLTTHVNFKGELKECTSSKIGINAVETTQLSQHQPISHKSYQPSLKKRSLPKKWQKNSRKYRPPRGRGRGRLPILDLDGLPQTPEELSNYFRKFPDPDWLTKIKNSNCSYEEIMRSVKYYEFQNITKNANYNNRFHKPRNSKYQGKLANFLPFFNRFVAYMAKPHRFLVKYMFDPSRRPWESFSFLKQHFKNKVRNSSPRVLEQTNENAPQTLLMNTRRRDSAASTHSGKNSIAMIINRKNFRHQETQTQTVKENTFSTTLSAKNQAASMPYHIERIVEQAAPTHSQDSHYDPLVTQVNSIYDAIFNMPYATANHSINQNYNRNEIFRNVLAKLSSLM